MLHLGFHYELHEHPASPEYQWVEPKMTNATRKAVAALCGRITDTKPKIPYGFDHLGVEIDPNTGAVTVESSGTGLTCASFIMQVLKGCGVQLLAEAEWPEGANREWQEQMLGTMRDRGVPETHIAASAASVGARRFRPEEVQAATTIAPKPVGFEQVAALANELRLALIPEPIA